MAAGDFFEEYFIRPIFESTGYNVFNTLAYGFLLIAVSYVIYRVIERYNVKVDMAFMSALAPYVFFSAFIRVLTDAGFYPASFFTVSPGIEMVIGLPALVAIIAVEVRWKKHLKKFALLGVILCLTQAPFYRIVSWMALGQVVLVFGAWLLLLRLLQAKTGFLANPLAFWALAANMLDATATFVTMQFYSSIYFEQHVLANAFMAFFGPAGMFVMKLVVLVPLFYIMQRYGQDKNLNSLIFVIIFFLGLAAGLRSSMRLVMMV